MIVTSLIFACSSNDDPAPSEDNTLVNAEFVYATTADQLKFLVQLSGLQIDPSEFLYDVEIYKVTYKTDYKESAIEASGLIAIPRTTDAVSMLSLHHGTIVNHADAPSNFTTADATTLSYAAIASAGLIGVIPDYLGFGASSSILHPYYIETLTASAILDMLTAASEFAQQQGLAFDGRLFLAGYSEGGYATMAAHKSLEENPKDGFTLIASFPGAGAYDLTDMQEHIFESTSYQDPFYLAYMAQAYQIHYEHESLITDLFQEPYASRIPALFDGTKGATAINAQLTGDISALIQEAVINGYLTDARYQYLRDAFAENSLTDWTPRIPMFLYHGLSDETVPYDNSVKTLNQLLANGASSGTVTLTPLEGTHSTAVDPYIENLIGKVLSLK